MRARYVQEKECGCPHETALVVVCRAACWRAGGNKRRLASIMVGCYGISAEGVRAERGWVSAAKSTASLSMLRVTHTRPAGACDSIVAVLNINTHMS